MRRETTLGILAVVGCGSKVVDEPPAEPLPTPTEQVVPSMNVVSKPIFELSHEASVLEEQRRLGGVAPDFYEEVPAKVIDPALDRPAQAVERFTIEGRPILWLSGDARQAVVDADILSSLTVVDVTRLRPGERRVVGVATERGRTMPPEALVELLLRARIIATYVHLGSEVTRERSTTHDGRFLGHYTGVHTYFTNEKVEQPFAFEVEIDDGTIAVTGAAHTSER